MKNSSMKDKKLILISIILLSVIWVIISNIIDNSIYLPKVNEVVNEILGIFKEKTFLLDVGYSLFRAIISFLVAAIIAILLGVLSSFSKYIYNFFYPINSIIKSIPTIAFILIALIWLNKNSAPYLIGIVISFPILYETTINSILNSNNQLIEMLNVYKVSFKDKLKNFYMQSIFINISQIATSTFSLAFKVVVAGEVFGQPPYGIGTAIQGAKINFNTAGIFAWIIIVALLSYILDKIIIIVINKALKGGRYLID
ncbi:ABC transporter permease subunit [Clostridium tertium]|uniref:Aliphatic sulfonates transport permease protein SsuC n=1 Tax=Clostridium tertium TaxID=1559 RepID=A0A6N3C1P5_9CLOT